MPSKKDGFIVLYPEYFDRSLTLNDGRRLPRNLAVSKPTTKMISNAARKLGLKSKVEADAHYPGRWYEKRGRVLILSKKTTKGERLNKTEILARIGKRLRDREKRAQEK